MRIFLDANLYISYLLKPESPSAACEVVRRAFSLQFEVLVCEPLVAELKRIVRKSPYPEDRIPQSAVDILITRLERIGHAVDPTGERNAWEVRDEKDRYILETAERGRADVIVSGDNDLLDDRAKWPEFRIQSASEFLAVWVLAKDVQ